MEFKDIFTQLRTLLTNTMGAEISFGQPTKVGDLHVIPVAKVAFGFGGGGGNSASARKKEAKETPEAENPAEPKEEKAKGNNFGGGGGGGAKTYPLGIYTLKGDSVKFHPVISIKEILAVMAFISVLLIRFRKINRKGK